MKTIYDLLQLIADELKMAENKVHKYTFDIDLKNGWAGMFEHSDMDSYTDGKWQTKRMYEKEIFRMKSIKTDAAIQEVYWTIYNNGRSAMKG